MSTSEVSILRVPSTKFTKPCPPVAPTSLWFSYSMGQLWFCTFPSSNNSNDEDIIASVMHTVVMPMLNPFIYSLRHRDMKRALGRFSRRRSFSSNNTSPSQFLILKNKMAPVSEIPFEICAKDLACCWNPPHLLFPATCFACCCCCFLFAFPETSEFQAWTQQVLFVVTICVF